MENREILSNAIDKAIANGWDGKVVGLTCGRDTILWDNVMIRAVTFSHSFAKAFWGEDIYVHWDESNPELEDLKSYKEIPQGEIHLIYLFPKGDYHWYQPIWAYHLQQMVLKKEPLKYLEQFL